MPVWTGAWRAHHHAITTMSGAMSVLRTSFTTVATSRASLEYAELAATTWLVSLTATPAHVPKTWAESPRAWPISG